jgi:hypothetical protein
MSFHFNARGYGLGEVDPIWSTVLARDTRNPAFR